VNDAAVMEGRHLYEVLISGPTAKIGPAEPQLLGSFLISL
jgi:hypothetical protein